MKKILSVAFSILIANQACAQLADESCKYLGNIIANSTPTDFITYWNQVTPENAGKWGAVEVTRDQMSWTALDNAYNTARDNGLLFKQHTFVWGQQQPTWLEALSAEEQKVEVEEWISEYCTRYPETEYIDVVNEPLHAVPFYKNAIGGNGATGWDWVVWSFEKARQYCPNSKLLLNDYNIINSNGSTDLYLQIINVLKERNLIDGIGEQGHFLETTPLETIDANLDKLAQTGLPIHISEFDLNFVSDTDQKSRYESLFPLLWEHPGVHGMTLWGYQQGQIWRTDAYLKRTNNTERPAFSWLKDFVVNSDGGLLCGGVAVENEQPEFRVYPNPLSGDQLTIDLDKEGYQLKVVDQMGRVVHSVGDLKTGLNEIDLTVNEGLYILIVTDRNHKSYQKKMLKTR